MKCGLIQKNLKTKIELSQKRMLFRRVVEKVKVQSEIEVEFVFKVGVEDREIL
ncbi:MAG: hypothetical protein ACYCVD_20205 [Desulfitobacteriaceae bacterium]